MTQDLPLCECGCGRPVRLNKQNGKPRRYYDDSCINRAKKKRAREEGRATKPEYSPIPESARILSLEEKKFKRELARGAGKLKILYDALEPAIKQVNPNTIKPITLKRGKREAETMVCLISDCHFGLVTSSYDMEVGHERGRYHIDRVVRIHEIMSSTVPIKKIVLIFLGDIVAGQNIYPAQAFKTQGNVMEQIFLNAAPFVIQFIKSAAMLAPVEAYFIRGNHGRSGKDAPGEVNFDLFLAMDIKRAFETTKIPVNVFWDFAALINIDGFNFFATHGDVIKSWNTIPFYGLINKGQRWQGSVNNNWDFLIHGHFHTAFCFAWNNFTIIGNGCYPTGDEFALQQLGMASLPVQQVFGIHPEHGLTWNYWLNLATKKEALQNNVPTVGIEYPKDYQEIA